MHRLSSLPSIQIQYIRAIQYFTSSRYNHRKVVRMRQEEAKRDQKERVTSHNEVIKIAITTLPQLIPLLSQATL